MVSKQMKMEIHHINTWDTAKAVLRGQLVAISSFIMKLERSQINNLNLHLRELEKEELIKLKVSRRKEIIKVRVEINKIDTRKTTEKIDKTKSWFFKKLNKIDKHLARLRKKREKTQIKLEMKKETLQLTIEIHRIIRDYWASLVAQWLRICLLMQGTRVRALVWEDPTCRGATGPVSHNY